MYFGRVVFSPRLDVLEGPPRFLRLTGHPVRWRLLSELARSDRQVRELTALTGQAQSLTSYHLGQLRVGGLVTTRRSSADGRDTYYSLDLAGCRDRLIEAGAALYPGLRLQTRSAGSGIGSRSADGRRASPVRSSGCCSCARATAPGPRWRRLSWNGSAAPRSMSAVPAPTPGALQPEAVRVMRDRGVDIGNRRSKHLSEFTADRFDYVISLCDRVREVCPDFPGAPFVAHWSIPDPAADSDATSDVTRGEVFARTADVLTTRVQFLLAAIENAPHEGDGGG